MKYTDKEANRLLTEYPEIVTKNMIAIWKTRGVIPKKYYENNVIKKAELTKDELILQNKIYGILASGKVRIREIYEVAGVSMNYYNPSKEVTMRPEHIQAIKAVLDNIRSSLQKVILFNKPSDLVVKRLDEALMNRCIVLSRLIENNTIRGRITARQEKKQTFYTQEEVTFIVQKIKLFLKETEL